MNTNAAFSLDQLDLELTRELERDARQAHTDLAAKLGTSRHTVRNRLQRLFDVGVMRPICYVDPVTLGYKYDVSLGINARPGDLQDIAKALASWSSVPHVMLSVGRFNLNAAVIFRDRDELLDFLTTTVGSIPGVERIETALKIQAIKTSAGVLTNTAFVPNLSVRLDNTDMSLIAELQRDATQKTSDLAKQLGISESTILRRIQKLKNRGAINITAATNPFALGYEGVAAIWMKADPDKVNMAAKAVAGHSDVRYVGIYTGACDIITWVIFKDLDGLRNFVNVELGQIPGLREIETMTHLKLTKFSYNYLEI